MSEYVLHKTILTEDKQGIILSFISDEIYFKLILIDIKNDRILKVYTNLEYDTAQKITLEFLETPIKKNIKNIDNNQEKHNIDKILCPLCNSIMIEKIGKYGKFIGCSNWPTCPAIMKNGYFTEKTRGLIEKKKNQKDDIKEIDIYSRINQLNLE